MEPLATEDPKLTQHHAPPGYWGWEPEAKAISIQISFDVVDRLLTSVIDGFGSIPKRGAEVGGLLLGSHTPGVPVVYRIDDFSDVTIRHKSGPSYLLCDEDHDELEHAIRRAGDRLLGFYRSHTREGLFLTQEDFDLTQRYFSHPDQIVLLIRPSAMGVSQAGFFYYEHGGFQKETYKEFPFRRSELETGSAPARRPLGERLRGEQGRRPLPAEPLAMPRPAFRRDELRPSPQFQSQTDSEMVRLPYGSQSDDEDIPMPSQVYAVTTPSQSRFRKGWYWLPLSFIFLLLGVLLGFQAAMTIYPTTRAGYVTDAYSLALSASRSGDDVTVKWDRQNAAVRSSPRGVLEITDGKYSRRVDLEAGQLRDGSVIYRFSSNQVRFKLEVFPQEHVSVSETIEWNGAAK